MEFASIFRAYDIRGIYGKTLNEEIAWKIGAAIGSLLKEGEKVIVGRDGRLSSEVLEKKLIEGILSTGVNVVDIGMVPTPVLYFASAFLKGNLGVMVTASHNPPEWNGFKICDGNGFVIESEKIQEIRKLVSKGEFKKGEGSLEEYKKILDDYSNFVLSLIDVSKKLKVAIDCGNGMASTLVPRLFKKLGFKTIVINEKIDGNFPGRGPDPTKEGALDELAKRIREENADFGVAFDGDSDRVVFVDENGNLPKSGGDLIIIFSEHYVKSGKGSKIVFDVACPKIVEQKIKEIGGIPIVERVGHSFIVRRMKEEDAVFGGEYSFHYYFKEIPGFDDAIFASLKFAEILSKADKSFSQLLSEIPTYYYKYDIGFECPDEKKFKVIERLREALKREGLKVIEIDGAKAFFEDGWILWRASNTRPKILIFVEGKNEESLNRLIKLAEEKLMQFMQ